MMGRPPGLQPTIVLLKEGSDRSQGRAQLISNINGCTAVVDTVRSTLGPRGMDKVRLRLRRCARRHCSAAPRLTLECNGALGFFARFLSRDPVVRRLSAQHSLPCTICHIPPLHSELQLIITPNGHVIISNDGATLLQQLRIAHPAAQTLVDIARAQVRVSVGVRRWPGSDSSKGRRGRRRHHVRCGGGWRAARVGEAVCRGQRAPASDCAGVPAGRCPLPRGAWCVFFTSFFLYPARQVADPPQHAWR